MAGSEDTPRSRESYGHSYADHLERNHFEDFSDLLASTTITSSMLGSQSVYQDDVNPFADAVSPLGPQANTTCPPRPASPLAIAPAAHPEHSPRAQKPRLDTSRSTAVHPWADEVGAQAPWAEPLASPAHGGYSPGPVAMTTAQDEDPQDEDPQPWAQSPQEVQPKPVAEVSEQLSAVDLTDDGPLASPPTYSSTLPNPGGWTTDPLAPAQMPNAVATSPDPERAPTSSSPLRTPVAAGSTSIDITVSDPHKVGDAMNAYVVYKVHTHTLSPAFDQPDYTVRRRYRDFHWLFTQLHQSNPGVIIPPVPEKQSLGRFQDEFVENRRHGLEKFLKRVATHPLLNDHPDFKLFLTSENFTGQTKDRRPEPSMGLMRAFGEVLTGSFSKFVEVDEWFENRRHQLDALESQLKALHKAIEAAIRQRHELAGAYGELSANVLALSNVEANEGLARSLSLFGKLQEQLHLLHRQQAQADAKTYESTTEEYIRLIGSIKLTFNARAKAYQQWQYDLADLQRKVSQYDRLKSQSRSRTDRMSQLNAEVGQLEIQTENHRHEFEDMSTLIRAELDRFDQEKVTDFKHSAEQFLTAMIGHQQQVIKLWEMYLESFDA
ncbi:Vacuolar protein sorting-associated protein vps5 [Dimargaris verticillata]|uniref:Vacuolar protein sorting-associated protein vps5 n=1 Tax=Dimargaris verticillata TaxID=2761393 RepID=A0A9W8ED81_9FUNG|nr:Vacuolar protein sorting-associated protein vps5 [Dimargaris verticillata]